MSLNCQLIAINLVPLNNFQVFHTTRLNKAYFLRKTYWLGSINETVNCNYISESEIPLIFGEPIINDFQEYIADPANAN
ncbi:hypothetical protein HC931_22835 [Candidatus Gracilibacteria bacterium]|jgi:hypothetical protein|nr:hypothetical protein [Candidatus Gracilibacteria bacterium]NJM90119.1 hypothetical protein [Hydrococcus sp. RU_2_2]